MQRKVFAENRATDHALLAMHLKIARLLSLPYSQASRVAHAGHVETERLLSYVFASVVPLNTWQNILISPCPEMESFFLGPSEECRVLRRNTPFHFLRSRLDAIDLAAPHDDAWLWAQVRDAVESVVARPGLRFVQQTGRRFTVISGGKA